MNLWDKKPDASLDLMAVAPLMLAKERSNTSVWTNGVTVDVLVEVPVLRLDPDALWVNIVKPRFEADLKGYTRELRDSFQMWQVEAETKMVKSVIEALEVLVERDPAKVEELLKAAKAARELREGPQLADTARSP